MPTPEVYLHGFMAGPKQWAPLHRLLTDACGPKVRLALSLPFHGSTPKGEEPASFAEACAQMWRHIDACCGPTTPVQLVGYSLGARMALAMACEAPHRVASLVLIGVNPGLSTDADRAQRRQSDSAWALRLRTQALPDVMRAWDAQALFAHRGALHRDAQAALSSMREGLSGAALARSLEVLGLAEMPNMSPALPHLTLPVHLVAGDRDSKFLRLAEQVSQQLPRATLWPIAGSGHDVVLTHPQAVAEVCLAAFGRGSGRA